MVYYGNILLCVKEKNVWIIKMILMLKRKNVL